jgi:hypothetical protein
MAASGATHAILERCRSRIWMGAVVEHEIDTGRDVEWTTAAIAQRIARKRR